MHTAARCRAVHARRHSAPHLVVQLSELGVAAQHKKGRLVGDVQRVGRLQQHVDAEELVCIKRA